MPTAVITGRDVTFTIGGNNFDAQATSAVLSGEMVQIGRASCRERVSTDV